MTWIQELFAQMSSVAIITGIFTWSATSIVKHISNKNIEKFRIEFKNDYEKQMEKYKVELNQQLYEHNVSYYRISERRMKIIQLIYKRIVKLQQSASFLVSSIEKSNWPSKEERYIEYQKSYISFVDAFYSNKLFLDKETSKKIEDILKIIGDSVIWFKNFVIRGEKKNSLDKRANEVWSDSAKKISEDVPVIIGELELEFQRILKIIDDKN
jgi:hypothetical protein